MRPLIHIGYHKTGTTWLQKQVFPKEDLGFSYVAGPMNVLARFFPPNPFDFDAGSARKRFEREIEEAEARGLVPVMSHERLSGSPYAGGHDSRTTADRLAVVFPEARILVSVREQTSVIISVYKQYLRWGGAQSLEQFLTPPEGRNRMPIFSYDFYEYHRLIGYYSGLFGEENVLALPFELLKSQPREFLGEVCDFLELPRVEPPSGRDNVSQSAFSLSLKRHVNRLCIRDALNPAPVFERTGSNKSLNKSLNLAAVKLDRKTSPKLRRRYENRWKALTEQKIGDHYAHSNALTEKLTGLDLQSFGYACER